MTIAGDFSANYAGALAAARRYSFFPANAANDYDYRIGDTTVLGAVPAAGGPGAPAVVNPGNPNFIGFRHIVVQGADQIAHIAMNAVLTGRGNAVTVRPQLELRPRRLTDPVGGGPVAVAAPLDTFRSYFLPWDPRGAVVELTIPPPAGGHPDFFFTAVLSGCSILFCGPATSPTVYHCGTAGVTGGGTPTVNDSNQFFLDLVRRCRIHLGLGRQDGALATDNRRVLSTDYMVTGGGGGVGIAADMAGPLGIFATQQAHFTGQGYHLAMLEPWGSVFGVRNAGSWEFYLQVNGTYVYTQVMRRHQWETWWVGGTYLPLPWYTGRDDTNAAPDNPQRADARPLFIRRVFPTAGAPMGGTHPPV